MTTRPETSPPRPGQCRSITSPPQEHQRDSPVRTTYPTNPDGVEVMLERRQSGTEEPPHSRPGDDMTVVVEGKVAVQFCRQEARRLFPDGEMVFLESGDVGCIRAGRVHDARHIEACRLVYVHVGAFAFDLAHAEAV